MVNALGRTTKEKDLGVTRNASMTVSMWDYCVKRQTNFGLIRRTITYKEKQLIVPLYKAIVKPHVEYYIQAYRKGIDKVERMQ